MTLAPVEITALDGLPRWVALLGPTAQLAERLARTEFVPRAMRDNPEAIAAAILYGDEIGVGPMQALMGIHVVEGRPAPSAELMRAMILRAGHHFTVHDMSGTRVRVSGLRSGRPESERVTVEWTLDMARSAGLLGRTNWKSYPRAMLMARATGDLARILFADVIKGLGYVVEEGESAQALEGWGPPEVAEQLDRAPRQIQRATRPKRAAATPVAAAQGAEESSREEQAAPAPDSSAPPASFPCSEPGCTFESGSPQGLGVHRARIHGPADLEPLGPEVDQETTDRWLTDEEAAAEDMAPMSSPPAAPETTQARPNRRRPTREEAAGEVVQVELPEELPLDQAPVEVEVPVAPGEGPPKIAVAPLKALQTLLTRELGTVATSEERVAMVNAILPDGQEVTSTKDLSRQQGYLVLEVLNRIGSGDASWHMTATGEILVLDEREPPEEEPEPPEEPGE